MRQPGSVGSILPLNRNRPPSSIAAPSYRWVTSCQHIITTTSHCFTGIHAIRRQDRAESRRVVKGSPAPSHRLPCRWQASSELSCGKQTQWYCRRNDRGTSSTRAYEDQCASWLDQGLGASHRTSYGKEAPRRLRDDACLGCESHVTCVAYASSQWEWLLAARQPVGMMTPRQQPLSGRRSRRCASVYGVCMGA